MDILVEELIIEDDRPAHIAKHEVDIKEVLQVIESDYVFIQGKHERWILIGSTKRRRMLAIVIGERKKKNVYGLVTARPADKKERSFYKELKQVRGGE